MISVKHLYHDYEGKGSFAVEDVSFDVPAGSIYGFLGPSGSGKSTVQNLLTKLLALQKGDVSYEGVPLRDIRPDFFNRVGYSFELPNLYTKLTGSRISNCTRVSSRFRPKTPSVCSIWSGSPTPLTGRPRNTRRA